MNFVWNKSNKEDYKKFNSWHQTLNDKYGENKNNYTKYIASSGCLIGDLLEVICEDSPVTDCYTALQNGTAVGFSMITVDVVDGKYVADVEVLGVNPDIQTKGIGTAMVFDIVKGCKTITKKPVSKITAKIHETNLASKRVFEKNYFNKEPKKVSKAISSYDDYSINLEELGK